MFTLLIVHVQMKLVKHIKFKSLLQIRNAFLFRRIDVLKIQKNFNLICPFGPQLCNNTELQYSQCPLDFIGLKEKLYIDVLTDKSGL